MLLNTFFLLKCLNRSLLYKLQCLFEFACLNSCFHLSFISIAPRNMCASLGFGQTASTTWQMANEAEEIFRFIDSVLVLFRPVSSSAELFFSLRSLNKRPIASEEITLL